MTKRAIALGLAALAMAAALAACRADPTPTPIPTPVPATPTPAPATATPTPDPMAMRSPELRAILEGAEAEGTVNIRTAGMSSAERAIFAEGFEEKFGFPVTIEVFEQHPSQYSTVLAQEAEAGKVASDMTRGGSSPHQSGVINAGGAQDVDFDVLAPLFDAAGQARLRELNDAVDPTISSACLADTAAPYAIVFNPNMIEKADVPTTWDGLTAPQYKGLIGMMSGGFPFGTLALNWGEDRILQFARDTKANDVQVISGGSNGVTEAVITGEASIGVASISTTLEKIGDGAPLDFVLPSDVNVLFLLNTCVLDGPNPNMAQLFTTWYAVEGRALASGPPTYTFNLLLDETGYAQELKDEFGLDAAPFAYFTGGEEAQRRTEYRNKVMEVWTGG